jgi:hypothetical protein
MMLLETQAHRQPAFVVSCLRCGSARRTRRTETGHLSSPECSTCGYLGWRELHEPADAA